MIDVFWDRKVQKDVEGRGSDKVEKAEEVDGDGCGGCKVGKIVSNLCNCLQCLVDLHGYLLLSIIEVYRSAERLTIQVLSLICAVCTCIRLI